MIKNIKNFLSFTLLLSSIAYQPIYTAIPEEPITVSTDAQSENTSNSESLQEEIDYLTSMLEIVESQSQQIYYSLYVHQKAVEQDKIDIDYTKMSKSDIAKQINACKEIIGAYYNMYMNIEFQPEQNCLQQKIAIGTLFNASMITYVLESIQKNITELRADDFEQVMKQLIDQIQNTESDLHKNGFDLDEKIKTNKQKTDLLVQLSESYDADLEIPTSDDTKVVDPIADAKYQQLQTFFDATKKQTQAILGNLQQLGLAIQAKKAILDETKVSKAAFLQEVELMKDFLQSYLFNYSTQPAAQGIVLGSICNKTAIAYITESIENNINILSAKTLQEIVNQNNSSDSVNLDVVSIIEENETNLTTLKKAVDTIGLTSLNKAFRYFENQPISVLGGTTLMQTTKNLAFYGSIAAGAYVAAIAMTKFNYEIPADAKHATDIIVKPTTFCGFELPGQKLIGKHEIYKIANTDGPIVLKEFARDNYGWFNTAEELLATSNTPLTATILGLLAANSKETYAWLKNKTTTSIATVYNYLAGRTDTNNDKSMFTPKLKPVHFKDMIGAEHLEKLANQIADFIEHPDRYETTGTTPPTGILLLGPAQTGKSLFAQGLCTKLSEVCSKQVPFINITNEMLKENTINDIFAYARYNSPCVLFIDEIDMLGGGTNRDISPETTQALLTNLSGLENDKRKPVIVIAATNRPEKLDKALKEHGRLGTHIAFEYPSYENRKKHIIRSLTKRNITILSPDYIDSLAQETEDRSFNTIDVIIASAIRESQFANRMVTQKDFENALDEVLRGIQQNSTMSPQEKSIVAMYHAGQAAARHILSTAQQVVKVTINPVNKKLRTTEGVEIATKTTDNASENNEYVQAERPRAIKLGNVFTRSSSNNKELVSNKDLENELLALIAGQATLELLTGQAYDDFGKEDRAYVLSTLEKRIAQGSIISDTIRLQAIAEKNAMHAKVKDIMAQHLALISIIKNALIKHTTIDRYQWAELTKNYIV